MAVEFGQLGRRLPSARPPSRRGLARRVRKALPLYLFLIPTFLGLVIFLYYPAILAIYRSFFEWDIGLPAKFIGLDNYVTMFTGDRHFVNSLKNMSYVTIWLAFRSTVIPMIVAEMIFAVRSLRLKYLFRVGMILPAIIPTVVVYLLWLFIYDGSIGLLNALLEAIGLGALTRAWLGDPNTAIWAIIFSGFPWVDGVATLIVLAGLQAINWEVIEASALDGASTVQRIFSVDLPLILGQLKLNLVRAIIGAVQMFEIIFVMTDGGPIKSTMVPGLWMYKSGFLFHRMGYASAIGVFLFVIILVLTVFNMRVLQSRD
jgi:raffinose/stachyose/melibiose transport system permease protein